MLANGSFKFILIPIIIAVFCFLLSLNFIGLGFLLVAGYMAWFFRDPSRKIVQDSSIIYAAADGTIKEVNDENDIIQIAIRMSPFNVHLNRAPVDAEINEITFKPGSHRSVYFAGAQNKNEQNLIAMESDLLKVDVLQITGAFARRIECWVEKNEQINQGDKIGIIRFGSQTNVTIEPKSKKELTIIPVVRVGDTVQAGITPIARIRSE